MKYDWKDIATLYRKPAIVQKTIKKTSKPSSLEMNGHLCHDLIYEIGDMQIYEKLGSFLYIPGIQK